MNELVPVVGEGGKNEALQSNRDSYDCPAGKYRQAANWNITYRFPMPVNPVHSENQQPSQLPEQQSKDIAEGDDVVTGYDFLGHLDTQAGRFYISRSGEQIAAGSWGPQTKFHFSCDAKSICLLTNLDDGSKLHAHRVGSARSDPASHWTGSFKGSVRNATAGKNADIEVVMSQTDGRVYGCLGVHRPLYGSGPLTGEVTNDGVRFDVRSSQMELEFHASAAPEGLVGDYKVYLNGQKSQEGTFTLNRQDARLLSSKLSPGHCPSDADFGQ